MPSTTRPRDRRLATLLGGAALVGATATMAVAAQTSLPGESLYGVKRGIESAQVRLADDDAARGRTLLAQAETRLTELEELAAGDGGAEQLVPDTLDAFTEQSGEGVRSLLTSYGSGGGTDADVQVARAFTSTSMDRLDALQGTLPDSASDELLAAGRTLTDLDTEISTACGLCDGAPHHDARLPQRQRGDRPGPGPRRRRAHARDRARLGPGRHRHHHPQGAPVPAAGCSPTRRPTPTSVPADDRADAAARDADADGHAHAHQGRRPDEAGQGPHRRASPTPPATSPPSSTASPAARSAV